MNQNQAFAAPIAVLALLAASIISCYSGYQDVPVPHEIKWQLSPLGLLFSFNPDFLSFETLTSFAGRFSLRFDYLSVFLKTCLLEAPFYYFVFRKRGVLVFLSVLFSANLLTHPMIYFFFPWLVKNFLMYALTAEIFAPLVEVVFVLMVTRRPGNRVGSKEPRPGVSALVILLANLFSWQMGAWV